MGKINHFLAENFGFSILGHLVVVGVIVLLADVVFVNYERFIAPDRIQITMIDLNSVRVTGDETILYNTNVDNSDKTDSKEPESQKQPEQNAAQNKTEELKSTALVSDAEDKKTKDSNNEKPDDVSAPKTKTVVRVNRNVVSLDRTLTVSVVDALRVAMTRCWNINTAYPGIDGIRAVAHLTMRQNGTVSDVWFESAARAETDPAFAYVLETIRSAINVCQPFRMLPPGEYDKWQKIQLTFYPTTGSVM
jgi:hypothetical protein